MADLPFPQPLSEKYAPRRVEDFVGLAGPKRVLANFLANPYPSAWLFVGPSGTGKTSMALAMAEQIPAELKHVPSRDCDLEMVEQTCRACHYFPWAGKKMHLVLVDEANEMTPAAQDAFLSKLDGTDQPPMTVFVFTTNDTYRLAERFQSRCRVLQFESSQPGSAIAAHLRQLWALERPEEPLPAWVDLDRIAAEAGNNLRAAMMKLELILLGLEETPAPAKASCGIMSEAVRDQLSELTVRLGAARAQALLQHACRDCGARLAVDGKAGPVTIRVANRMPEVKLLAALKARAMGECA
jgi:replication-associated recombination protein RarA